MQATPKTYTYDYFAWTFSRNITQINVMNNFSSKISTWAGWSFKTASDIVFVATFTG